MTFQERGRILHGSKRPDLFPTMWIAHWLDILIAAGLVANALIWLPAVADRVNVADISCPARPAFIRYPEGMRQAVCNPTGINWSAATKSVSVASIK